MMKTSIEQTPRPDLREWLPPDKPDRSELDDDGLWRLDTWRSPFGATVEILVAYPRPTGERTASGGTRYAQQVWRKYVFDGGDTHQIPRAHRHALQQVDKRGQITGGLLPQGQLVGEENPAPIDPGLARTLTSGKAAMPWAPPPPVARTIAERGAPRTPEELDELMMSRVRGGS
jgi:hypothetical protein